MLITLSNDLFQSFTVHCRDQRFHNSKLQIRRTDPYLKNRDPEHVCSMFYTLPSFLVLSLHLLRLRLYSFNKTGFRGTCLQVV
jgi:hypothetical protein